jgi:iron-sulfur cluster repair protein YtfE (RIC family)
MPAAHAPEATARDGNATRCLETDHRHLDALLLEVEQAASAGRFPEAREHLSRLAAGLIRHIDAEETLLFPQLVKAEPGATGPVSVMRFEHQEFRDLLERMVSQLAPSSERWRDTLRLLKKALVVHNTKEERVLYPLADELARRLGSSADLAERLRAALEQ